MQLPAGWSPRSGIHAGLASDLRPGIDAGSVSGAPLPAERVGMHSAAPGPRPNHAADCFGRGSAQIEVARCAADLAERRLRPGVKRRA